MQLEKNVEIFLKQTYRFEKPLLLGFSGGSDSLALAHCLFRLQIPFHLAHYDHGWREKSGEECQRLGKWASSHQIPFYSRQSEKGKKTELAAREERYQFFEKLFQSGEFEALLLAHHSADQIETILKRVLEGAHLTNLRGMQPIAYKGKMPIWRPLLDTPKEVILQYLENHSLTPIEDETNRDPKYLRARMRHSMIPKLSEEFGKEVSSSLHHLGKQSQILRSYLDQQTKKYLPIEGPFGKMWDFSTAHPIEIQHVLSLLFALSRPILSQITRALQRGLSNHHVLFGGHTFIADRQKLFWIERAPPLFTKEVPLQPGVIKDKDWEWEIAIGKEEATSSEDWLFWWKGKISLVLASDDYELAPPSPYFRKRWNTNKVPAFLRESLPTIRVKGKPIAEFLTGTAYHKWSQSALLVTITIYPRKFKNRQFCQSLRARFLPLEAGPIHWNRADGKG